MIVHNVPQYSREWWDLRLGIPTASRFGSIITAKTRKPSKSVGTMIAELLIESIFKKPSDYNEGSDDDVYGFERDGTPWMKRGSEVEAEARIWYQLQYGVKVDEVGFCTTDDGKAGCSPDGLLGEDGGAEIKCRSAKYHMRILLGHDSIAEEPQVQGSMWVTDREYWDAIAFCPGLPSKRERFYRDPEWMNEWTKAFGIYTRERQDAEERLSRIEEDVIESDNLAALFASALQKKPTRPALPLDDLNTLRKALERAYHIDLVDDRYFLGVIEAIRAEDWDAVEESITDVTARLDDHFSLRAVGATE